MHGSSGNTFRAADYVVLKFELLLNKGFLVATWTCYIGSRGWLTVVQRMAERHISVPTSLAGRDVADWFQRFEICSRANRCHEGFEAPHATGGRGPRDMDGSKHGMVLNKLKANVRYFYSSLLKHLQREDSSGSGGVTTKYFQVGAYVQTYVHT